MGWDPASCMRSPSHYAGLGVPPLEHLVKIMHFSEFSKSPKQSLLGVRVIALTSTS